MLKLKTLFLSTRPQFFPAVILPVTTGTSYALYKGASFDALSFFLALIAAILYHGGMNVLNDYFDSRSGADEMNLAPLTPFAGGNRMIQKGLMSQGETLLVSLVLLFMGSAIGLYLVWLKGIFILIIGVLGLLTGVLYSAPPVFLAGRGLGEATVFLNFGVLTAIGAYFLQAGNVSLPAAIISLPIGFLIAAILYVNEFPDYESDKASGKRNLVVRWTPEKARYGMFIIGAMTYLSVVIPVITGHLPLRFLAGLISLPFFLKASMGVMSFYEIPDSMKKPIKFVILSHVLTGAAITIAFILP
ncbi:MAG: prenyltransferase [Thermodesulfobacteriota bacterium]